MNRDKLAWLVILALLLVGGLVLGRRFMSPAGTPVSNEGEAFLFRQWFWENRGLDLAVQVALIFAGALGLAALLPMDESESRGKK